MRRGRNGTRFRQSVVKPRKPMPLKQGYRVGEAVRRDDGRFYVPVVRIDPRPGVDSQVVMRVASDAFLDLKEAVMFAEEAAAGLNWRLGYDE